MATQMALTKTEQAILDRLATRRSGVMSIETLADGRRMFSAALRLIQKELVTLVRSDSGYVPVRKGQGRNLYWTNRLTSCVLIGKKATATGEDRESGQGQA